jgi:hypothetical protein
MSHIFNLLVVGCLSVIIYFVGRLIKNRIHKKKEIVIFFRFMSDYIPLLPYKLEQLPNEILLEIFDYMQINDLLRAFYNLNNRFNSFLFSSNIHLRILYPDDIEENSIKQKLLVNSIINQRYISRLRLIHNKNIPDHRFINFSYIRSLILDTPTSKLIEIISPKIFPHLEYLRIGYYTSVKTQLNKLHQLIFSNQFPLLKKCSLNNVNDNQIWTGSPSIRLLGIWSDDPRTVVERVLFASPCLISLHLFLTWPLKYSILDEQIIEQHSNLKYLKLHLSSYWTLDKLDSFLAYIPTIENLNLLSSYFDSHMIYFQWNFKELGNIFLCRLPNLSYFDCELIFRNQKLIDFKNISLLHSCFNRIKYEIYSEDDLFVKIFTDK